MDGIGAICDIGWLSTSVPSLGERAEAGTAIAAKMAKIGRTLKVCRYAPGLLQNDKREATSSRRQSKPSFMHNTRSDGRAAQLFVALGSDWRWQAVKRQCYLSNLLIFPISCVDEIIMSFSQWLTLRCAHRGEFSPENGTVSR